MNRAVPREWESLQFKDPERILVGLRHIATTQPLSDLPYKVAALRTRDLRTSAESRQAALFAYGVGKAMNRRVSFALSEASDYDAIFRYAADGVANYVPVQLKEWVPAFLNPEASLQSELDKLSKYTNSQDLTVAVHLNRDASIHVSSLRMPTNLGELWFYGAIEPNQARWLVIGNLLKPAAAKAYEFLYPAA